MNATDFFDLFALLLAFCAFFGWLNARIGKLPGAIGLTAVAMGSSLALFAVGSLFPGASHAIALLYSKVSLPETLFHGMLAFLLFAGAMHVDAKALWAQKRFILILSTVSVAVSTLAFGAAFHAIAQALGVPVNWGFAFLLGAVVSPTDPVCAMALLKKAGLSKALEAKIAGESLLNDGVAMLAFSAALPFALAGDAAAPFHVGTLLTELLREAAVALAVGLAIGFLCRAAVSSIEHAPTEIMLSLAAAAGSWAVAERLHSSPAIAVVVCGLWMGLARHKILSETARERFMPFWETLDELLNAVLFSVIGIHALLLAHVHAPWLLAIAAIFCALGARWVSVAVPLFGLRPLLGPLPPKALSILTWGGIRGGITVALALSTPGWLDNRDLLICASYAIVAFSILVQGLSLPILARSARQCAQPKDLENNGEDRAD
jgi:monovalent cation:H+ antiporter, CPA1 family